MPVQPAPTISVLFDEMEIWTALESMTYQDVKDSFGTWWADAMGAYGDGVNPLGAAAMQNWSQSASAHVSVWKARASSLWHTELGTMGEVPARQRYRERMLKNGNVLTIALLWYVISNI